MRNIPGVLMVFAAILVIPALIARFVVGGDWRQVGAAYLIWFALLFCVLFVPGKGQYEEKFGWMIIMSMFLSILAVPVITLIQRIGGWILFKLG